MTEGRSQSDAEILKLANKTYTVFPGQPLRIFGITNKAGEVFEGYLEMFTASNEHLSRAPIVARVAEEAPAAFVIPTTNQMRELGTRMASGDDAAFEEVRRMSIELYRNINYRTESARVLTNLFLMRAALDELGVEAGKSNAVAMAALRRSLTVRHMSSFVPYALSIAAAAGNDEALDMLLHYSDWGILLSSAESAMRLPAQKENEKAIEFLVQVLDNPAHRALWNSAVDSLKGPAARGNAKAKEALEKYEQNKPQ
jgi:hypothetical protein